MTLRNGRVVSKEIHDYPGFISQPMSWEMAFEKFERITAPFTTASLRHSIADAVKNLDSIQVRDLTQLFHNIERPHSKTSCESIARWQGGVMANRTQHRNRRKSICFSTDERARSQTTDARDN